MPTDRPPLVLVHDYLTQRGGAERVVLHFAATFPGAPLRTSLYDPAGTFEAFASVDVRTGVLDRVGALRRHHRAALPVLAPWFASQRIDADVVLASSSGWAHEVRTDGRLLVYCHAPARWLYQADRYLGATGTRRGLGALALSVLGPPLRAADRAAARRAERYLANSTATAALVGELYGRDAEVLCPPPGLSPDGERRAVGGLEGGFVLCVSRLLPYKHVDVLIAAARLLGDRQVVVVGEGPARRALEADAPGNVRFCGTLDDPALRWCYANAAVLCALGYEDFGLAPLEAAGLGTPTVARRFGGFLDTIEDGTTGVLLGELTPGALARAIDELAASPPSRDTLVGHAARFAPERFASRLRALVAGPGG